MATDPTVNRISGQSEADHGGKEESPRIEQLKDRQVTAQADLPNPELPAQRQESMRSLKTS
jgi:hypothetical protein